jgi:hypothetical protein
MYTMTEKRVTRDFIPSGNCVPTELIEDLDAAAFIRLDNGNDQPDDIQTAVDACRSCHQLEYCHEQAGGIAEELWRRGVRNAIVGGTAVAAVAAANQLSDFAGDSAFRFDYSRLKKDGSHYLDLLRQACRSRQIRPTRVPESVITIGKKLDGLMMSEPRALSADALALKPPMREYALGSLVTVICMLDDWSNINRNNRNPTVVRRRYDPATFEYHTNLPIAYDYMNDVAAIESLGYRDPPRLGMYHSLRYLRTLRERYAGLAASHFYTVVGDNPIDPLPALTSFISRLGRQR